jgi:aerobic carbon-monoxide dehydrogenase small subunit
MSKLALTVNDRLFETQVEPRTHLGDFLRDQLRLTGTHLGCEHGVCGACTVLINGSPARACITLAVACEGLAVRTIEGFDQDPLMRRIRAAFSREHGLQCGFCTPGMVITARDIALRLPDADEARVRRELTGNLCRCTGYAGIVSAVCSVLKETTVEERLAAQATNAGASGMASQALAPGPATAAVAVTSGFTTFTPRPSESSGECQAAALSHASFAPRAGWSRFEESFEVHEPPSRVWSAFRDIPFVARCLPGAEVSEQDGRTVKGRFAVKLGPIAASFVGSAVVERDDSALAGMIKGAGNDSGSGSRTKGEIAYRLDPAVGGQGTRVRLVVDYSLQGPLAQFSRTGLAQELARGLIAEFAANLERGLARNAPLAPASTTPLNVGALLWRTFRGWLRWLFDRA